MRWEWYGYSMSKPACQTARQADSRPRSLGGSAPGRWSPYVLNRWARPAAACGSGTGLSKALRGTGATRAFIRIDGVSVSTFCGSPLDRVQRRFGPENRALEKPENSSSTECTPAPFLRVLEFSILSGSIYLSRSSARPASDSTAGPSSASRPPAWRAASKAWAAAALSPRARAASPVRY